MKVLLFLGIFLFNNLVLAAEIKAIVNDEPISSQDIQLRIKILEMQQPGFSKTEKKSILQKKVLEQLINEEIKRQEGRKKGYKIEEKEILKAIAHLEGQFGLANGEFKKMVAKNGIPFKAVQNQIEADLYWLYVMKNSNLPIEPISDKQVNQRLEFLKQELLVPGYFVSEIWVKDKKKALKIFEDLINGGNFEALAKENSVAPSSNQGGNVGWVKQGYYPFVVEEVLDKIEVGQLSRPIQTENGYVILLLHDKKEANQDSVKIWELAQMAIQKEKITPLMSSLIQTIQDCSNFMEVAKNIAIPESIKRGQLNPVQLPKNLLEVLEKEKTKSLIGPIDMDSAVMYFMKCQEIHKSLLPSKELIREKLGLEQAEILSEKLLKNMRRRAVIEYK